MATDDCMDALLWLIDHATDLGIDTTRISIGGTSAGGNLAAVLVQRAVLAQIKIQFQLLLVPVIHYGCVTRSCLENAYTPLLGVQEIVWFHHMYGRNYSDGLHPHYNPLMLKEACRGSADTPMQWPKTLIVTAQKDALRDDGLDYATYLDDCGVDVIRKELPGSHWSVYSHPEIYWSELEDGVCN